jgi:MarR family transcriptional regulator, temperature-dependent positive regulator of motility
MAREPDSGQLQQSPMHLLHRAGQHADSLFDAGARESNLTPRQLAVLIEVGHSDGPNQTEIAERTGVDRSTLSELVRRLQKKRLLQRRRTKEDARAYSVAVTDKGRQLLRTIEPIAKRIDEQVLAALTSRQRERFIDALKSIVAAVQGSSKDVHERSVEDGGPTR